MAQTPVSQFVVTAPTSSAYLFDGAGFPSGTSGNNPDIYLKKGQTYYFRNTSIPLEYNQQHTSEHHIILELLIIMSSLVVVIFHALMMLQTLYYQCSSHG